LSDELTMLRATGEPAPLSPELEEHMRRELLEAIAAEQTARW
jgi:hypothetical protein